MTRNGFAAPTDYYRNHEANRLYSDTSLKSGRLDMPVLYIEAFYDLVADTSVSRLAEPMRQYCTDLTEKSIDAGHWVLLERPTAVNAALADWLARKVPWQWPRPSRLPPA